MLPISLLQQKEIALQIAWSTYQKYPTLEHFIEFILLLNSLTDALSAMALSGPLHECQRLEKQAMDLFGEGVTHPIPDEWMEELMHRVQRFCRLLAYYSGVKTAQQQERRAHTLSKANDGNGGNGGGAGSGISICLMGECGPHWQELVVQLGYFGFSVRRAGWEAPEIDEADLGIYLVDLGERAASEWQEHLKALRERRPMAHIVCLSVPNQFVAMHAALQAGADHCLVRDVSLQRLLEQILGHNNDAERESCRVLVVEDSRTTAYAIRRSLESYGITVQVLHEPTRSLDAVRQFQPDLILMDMYMPGCTGVEVARVIRLHDEFLGIPIVYLSGETNITLQVEALRLGGDQFLTKPFNPVLMNAVIKSKIDRYRALRRSMQNDSLTGLLNHISSKQALAAVLKENGDELAIVMLDIDHFKRVNDEHGHPVGDHVIQSLAWLLRQRLRQTDIIGRYGGEEFVVGLIGARLDDANDVMGRIREDFSRISFRGVNGNAFRVTLSAGVVIRERGDDDLATLLETADSALYEAKRQGRNRVVVAGQATEDDLVLEDPFPG
ncbi:MAG: diguanylate cyclase [Zoogloeaceae bacterium]|jgi:diguanylate cyclase (GGDEF)-like protein|nr:diguanylate cyclase [Zoogloeaceae bacterium]